MPQQNDDPKDYPALLARLARDIRAAKQAARPHVPVYPGDPPTPSDGDVWINTTTNLLRIRMNGVNRTITTT